MLIAIAAQAAVAIDIANLFRQAQNELAAHKLAEEALQKSEERLRQLLSLMPAAVYTIDEAGRITFFYRRAVELWGREPALSNLDEKFCGSFRLWLPDGSLLPHDKTPMASAIQEGASCRNREVVIERPDGSRITVNVNIDPLRDATGKICGAINCFQDISELKAAGEAVRQSELRLRTMAESLPNLVWTDLPDGRCDWLSSQWERYTGVPVKDLLGINWLDRVIHPEDRAGALACWQAACEDRGDYDLEYRIRRYDGQYRWFKTRGVPIRDQNNKITYWFGTCTDIEDMKQAEIAVQRLAAIVEFSEDAIFSIDLEGTIQNWNRGAARLFGYEAAEIVGNSITILMPNERLDDEPEILDRIARGESLDHYETLRRCKDGTLRNISLTVSPIKDASGKIIGASKVGRDISDKVRAKEQLEHTVTERTASLREAITQMEEFSYSVSHDLRSPVRAMHGYATALSEDYGERLDEDGKEYLERIIQGSSRMERLIHDVLTYSRISRTNMHLQPVSLHALLRSILQQYPEFSRSRADILVEPDLSNVLAHEPSLGQALANLLANAVKFVHPGVKPKVLVSAEHNNGIVFVRIRDNGIGIEPEYQPRLFGMFERIHPDGKYEGTGIGLAIVRKTVERMGGKVGVESDGVNGSTFWIQLPQA